MFIRRIEKKDNAAVANIVRSVLMEMGAPKVGTAYADPNLDTMFETYQKANAVYFVIESDGEVVGCAGIDRLANVTANICELQKMYFLPKTRGLGMGSKMMEACMAEARAFGYEKCYLETMPYMAAAQELYKKSGFYYIDEPMGNTGHTSCPVWMMKDLG
ncbi:MAG: GNAT family N-acetyltransferase [Ferruginibacter sp.]